MRPQAEKRGPDAIQLLGEQTFYGREKDNLPYPIALANLVLHGIDDPHIWHGNTLTDQISYGGLFEGAPATFDVVLTNPPFGGKEGKEAQTRFAYKTGATRSPLHSGDHEPAQRRGTLRRRHCRGLPPPHE